MGDRKLCRLLIASGLVGIGCAGHQTAQLHPETSDHIPSHSKSPREQVDTPAPVATQLRAMEVDLLPAGLFFRDGYLRRFDTPTTPPEVLFAGPFSTEERAESALEALLQHDFPPGYPIALHSDEIAFVDDTIDGIILVVGLFEHADSATHWNAELASLKLRVEPTLDFDQVYERNGGTWTPRRHVVRVGPAGAHAYSKVAIWNVEHRATGEGEQRIGDPLVQMRSSLPACKVPANSLFVAERDAYAHYPGLRWAPVTCGDTVAYVPHAATYLDTLFLPQENAEWLRVQVASVECDQPTFRKQTVKRSEVVLRSRLEFDGSGC